MESFAFLEIILEFNNISFLQGFIVVVILCIQPTSSFKGNSISWIRFNYSYQKIEFKKQFDTQHTYESLYELLKSYF